MKLTQCFDTYQLFIHISSRHKFAKSFKNILCTRITQ